MKAHSMRRSIWFLNVALIAAIVGVGAWWFVDVREAVAKVPKPQGRKAPKQYVTMVKGFNTELDKNRPNILSAPVKQKDLNEVILIEDYKKRDPTHFIFTGPLPPEKIKSAPTKVEKPPEPKGLKAIGDIAWMIYGGAENTMIAFQFKGGKKGYFNIGDFVKDAKTKPDRFKLIGATEPEPNLYVVQYEVYDAGKDEPVDTAEMEWDNRRDLPKKGDGPIYVDPGSLAVEAGEGAPGEGEGAPGEGESTEGEGTDPRPPLEPTVIEPTAADEPVTYDELNPTVRQVNTRLVEVEFDAPTRKYFTQRDAKKMVESVKTQVAKDSVGNVIGLKIVDPGEAPADKLSLRRGDIIVSINGQPVKERADVVRIAENLPEDIKRVTIVVDRLGRKITFNVDPRDPKTRRAAAQAAGRMEGN